MCFSNSVNWIQFIFEKNTFINLNTSFFTFFCGNLTWRNEMKGLVELAIKLNSIRKLVNTLELETILTCAILQVASPLSFF